MLSKQRNVLFYTQWIPESIGNYDDYLGGGEVAGGIGSPRESGTLALCWICWRRRTEALVQRTSHLEQVFPLGLLSVTATQPVRAGLVTGRPAPDKKALIVPGHLGNKDF